MTFSELSDPDRQLLARYDIVDAATLALRSEGSDHALSALALATKIDKSQLEAIINDYTNDPEASFDELLGTTLGDEPFADLLIGVLFENDSDEPLA